MATFSFNTNNDVYNTTNVLLQGYRLAIYCWENIYCQWVKYNGHWKITASLVITILDTSKLIVAKCKVAAKYHLHVKKYVENKIC